jgi:hypothetical protein
MEELCIACTPTIVEPQVAPISPTQFLERLQECRGAKLPLWIVGSQVHEHSDPAHPFGLLCAYRDRPWGRCRAHPCDECSSPHSICLIYTMMPPTYQMLAQVSSLHLLLTGVFQVRKGAWNPCFRRVP